MFACNPKWPPPTFFKRNLRPLPRGSYFNLGTFRRNIAIVLLSNEFLIVYSTYVESKRNTWGHINPRLSYKIYCDTNTTVIGIISSFEYQAKFSTPLKKHSFWFRALENRTQFVLWKWAHSIFHSSQPLLRIRTLQQYYVFSRFEFGLRFDPKILISKLFWVYARDFLTPKLWNYFVWTKTWNSNIVN